MLLIDRNIKLNVNKSLPGFSDSSGINHNHEHKYITIKICYNITFYNLYFSFLQQIKPVLRLDGTASVCSVNHIEAIFAVKATPKEVT